MPEAVSELIELYSDGDVQTYLTGLKSKHAASKQILAELWFQTNRQIIKEMNHLTGD